MQNKLFSAGIFCAISMISSIANASTECEIATDITIKNSITNFELSNAISKGKLTVHEGGNAITSTFMGEESVYILAHRIDAKIDNTDYLNVAFNITGWEKVNYLAFGWRDRHGKFWHAKSTNPPQGIKINEILYPNSIAFKLSQGWDISLTDQSISSIEIFIKGTPSESGATISILDASILSNGHSPEDAIVKIDNRYCLASDIRHWFKDASFKSVSEQARDAIGNYLRTVDSSYLTDSDNFLQTGDLSLPGIDRISWESSVDRPAGVSKYTTTRYLWHALSMSNSLVSAYEVTSDTRYIFAARDLADRWLSENFYKETDDLKYAWYDHGAAMRLIAFLRLWDIGIKEQFDARFMNRLLDAISAHGQLLASEAFYVRNQVMRYHNHGIFQDISLFLIHEYLPELHNSGAWQSIALNRMREQFMALSTKEGEFTVNAENSLGYHYGFQGLCTVIQGALKSSETPAVDIIELCEGLDRFSELISYPDGRGPSYGDSFRRPNDAELAAGLYTTKERILVLPESGYAIVEAKTDSDIPFKLVMVAPSKTIIHKHEDNLSFSLWAAGVEWLIDPGFYTHQYTDPYPSYARSYLAHNALVLEGHTYSIEPGQANITSTHIEADEDFAIMGSHTGFTGASVTRRIGGKLSSGEFKFTDSVKSPVNSTAALMFHTGEQIDAQITDGKLMLTTPLSDKIVAIKLPRKAACEIIRGREANGILGWSFPTFANKTAIDSIKCDVPINQPVKWEIKIIPPAS